MGSIVTVVIILVVVFLMLIGVIFSIKRDKRELRKEELRKEELRKEELRKEELRKEELRKEFLRKEAYINFPKHVTVTVEQHIYSLLRSQCVAFLEYGKMYDESNFNIVLDRRYLTKEEEYRVDYCNARYSILVSALQKAITDLDPEIKDLIHVNFCRPQNYWRGLNVTLTRK